MHVFLITHGPKRAEPLSFQKSEAKVEADPEKNQARYNLRRRKDDGATKEVTAKPEQLEEEVAKKAAAPAAIVSTAPDFGGKIGG